LLVYEPPGLTLKTLHFSTKSWCVLYNSYNKQPSFLCTVIRSFYRQHIGRSVRYELSGYTKHREILVFKGAIVWLCRIPSRWTDVQTRQAMYIYCNTEVHLCNQCCYGKAINTTHSEYVFVDSVIHHAKHMCLSYYYLWLVWLYNIFPHYLVTAQFLGKKVLNIKCVFWFTLQIRLKHFSFQEEFSKVSS